MWSGQTLAEIGLGSVGTQTVYTTAGGGDTILFTTVPEPSSLILGGLGIAGALLRRRRA
ncbi:MAG: PEP-CTERM sorting domain-containing protein [Armatimonadetes bacterium]|nr:PEP-CTERM sorting domain-containing protein [Akkermansiaceae bacterium]